jgi:hypothetical protein
MISGLLLSLGLLYPIFMQFVFVSPQWFGADTRPAAMMPGMLLSGMLTLLGFLTMGILPVERPRGGDDGLSGVDRAHASLARHGAHL